MMLLPDFLFHAADKVVDIWERLNVFAIKDICRRIADAEKHMTASADWQIYKLKQAGQSFDVIKRETQKILNASDAEIKQIFEESIINGYQADAEIYKQAGITPQPFNTELARKQLQVYFEQTNGELYNYTRTTAIQSQNIYINACDDAFLRIKSGLQSSEQAILEAMDTAASNGLYIHYPTGHRDTIEVAVRRAVTTGINRASMQMTIDECERQGTNYVIVSSHLGARVAPDKHGNHYGWQGKVYMIKPRAQGFWGKLQLFNDMIRKRNYPLLEDATGYPSDPRGLGGYNCRHSMYPYIPDITENNMRKFDADANKKEYELSQEMRRRERAIRKTRRLIEGEKAGVETASGATIEAVEKAIEEHESTLKRQLEDYSAFCKANGLHERLERSTIANIAI